ncbi:oligosaccharyltransferase complex subunit gamma [Cryptococcus wingfieldii CBS 7118]|uniref:Oligosaccharyltransferase complex subunit gamma n=1 Tax=Cryptococcus wingfieldii CBS 7118 TaxID=1295528 RepID=A0A1E3IKC8_9TREE|nr:oligosaccharyltransferase complex subunit gamma [Cryptococcus wingfieldii CBS 7118]ODN88406.1 oligosaccharyltransferase complex subunit gamma [Cryptococcus wingfieldii CBS 7118]
MRLPSLALIGTALSAITALAAQDPVQKWSQLAAKSRDGVIKLDSESYQDLLALDREYSVTVLLTALPAQFKCQPCHNFDPSFSQVADSWARLPRSARDQHFFAKLDFADGQAVYSQLGLTSAPTVMFHPPLAGERRNNKLGVINYDMNRNGLSVQPFYSWAKNLTPQSFDLHVPLNPWPFILIPLALAFTAISLYTLSPILIPLIQSRVVWGTFSIILILTFTSGYMWNKIKGAPYVAVAKGGGVSWIAGGYQNQLGLESQVVGGIYGLLAFSIVALTVFVPSQSSPAKQRIGVYLWLGMLVVVFSLLMKLFKMKNGGYPFSLLF